MSFYNQQEFDIINRTIEILNQYDTFNIEAKDNFRDTLFINCLIGLLIIPQQHWFDDLPDKQVTEHDWGISEYEIAIIKLGEDKTVKNVARHIRNSISHYKFKVLANVNNEIDKINFQDFAPNGERRSK